MALKPQSVKAAKMYRGPTEEPRIYDVERLAKAGYSVSRPLPSVTTILRVLNKPAFVPAALKAMGDAAMKDAMMLKDHALLLESDQFVKGFKEIVDGWKKAWGARSREAMDIGSRIHKLCEDHGRGIPVDIEQERKEVQHGFSAYLKWVNETGFVALPQDIEKVVAGDGYAGTADALGVLRDGTPCLVDWKSGKSGAIYNEYVLQWNAYSAALGVVEDGYIVSFDKETGDCYHKRMKFDVLTYRAFLACREIYEWQDRQEEKK